MRYCLMNSFFLYWNQERRFPMNKKYLLQIIIIASLVFGGFALFILLFLTKHQILFFTENNISDHLFRYFLDSANLQSCGCRLAIFVNEQNNKI